MLKNCLKARRDTATHLRHRVRGHQSEDVRLNPFVQLDHRLQLARMQRVPDARLDVPFHSRVLVRGDLVHVRDELGAEIVVDIELAWGGWGEVG